MKEVGFLKVDEKTGKQEEDPLTLDQTSEKNTNSIVSELNRTKICL